MSDTAAKEPDDKTKIDFGAMKTEAEWSKTIDNFWKRATPLWFQWMEWLFILGAVAI